MVAVVKGRWTWRYYMKSNTELKLIKSFIDTEVDRLLNCIKFINRNTKLKIEMQIKLNLVFYTIFLRQIRLYQCTMLNGRRLS